MSDEVRIDFDKLCEFQGPVLSNCHVGIKIPMHSLGAEGFEKILAAEAILAELGVTFDHGLGFGITDWEFDWSLSGAAVRLKPLWCMGCQKYLGSGTWPCRVLQGGTIRTHCSASCREADTREGIDLDLFMHSGIKPPPREEPKELPAGPSEPGK